MQKVPSGYVILGLVHVYNCYPKLPGLRNSCSRLCEKYEASRQEEASSACSEEVSVKICEYSAKAKSSSACRTKRCELNSTWSLCHHCLWIAVPRGEDIAES